MSETYPEVSIMVGGYQSPAQVQIIGDKLRFNRKRETVPCLHISKLRFELARIGR